MPSLIDAGLAISLIPGFPALPGRRRRRRRRRGSRWRDSRDSRASRASRASRDPGFPRTREFRSSFYSPIPRLRGIF